MADVAVESPGALDDDETLVAGHVTIDVRDGEERLGGAALYSGLALAMLGFAARIVTAAEPEVLRTVASLHPRLAVDGEPSDVTTRFVHRGAGELRQLRLMARSSPVPRPAEAAAAVFLAPVANELADGWKQRGRERWRLLLAQGLVRTSRLGWLESAPARIGDWHPDVSFLSAGELPLTTDRTGVVVVTAGGDPVRVVESGRERTVAIERRPFVDDVGAGDVFAAATYAALVGGDPLEDAIPAASRTVVRLLPELHARLAEVR
jgi:hypothetical protein